MLKEKEQRNTVDEQHPPQLEQYSYLPLVLGIIGFEGIRYPGPASPTMNGVLVALEVWPAFTANQTQASCTTYGQRGKMTGRLFGDSISCKCNFIDGVLTTRLLTFQRVRGGHPGC